MIKKKILLLDQDNILADTYPAVIDRLNARYDLKLRHEDKDKLFGDHKILVPYITNTMLYSIFDEPNFFSSLCPIKGAIEAVQQLTEHFNVYIVTAPWISNDSCCTDKVRWIGKYLPSLEKKVILTKAKEAVYGDIFIDDKNSNLVEWKQVWTSGRTGSLQYHWTDPKAAEIVEPDWDNLSRRILELKD